MMVVRITPQIHGLVEYLFGFFQAMDLGRYSYDHHTDE